MKPNQKKIGVPAKVSQKKWIYPFGLAGWGQQGAKIQPKKILFSTKKYKDDQNGLIHPEN